MSISLRGKELIREVEGLRTEVYPDSGGAPTIGIGHLLTKAERMSGKLWIGTTVGDYREGLTIDQCWELLEQDLVPAEKAINDFVSVPLSQNRFDSLVSFVLNVGVEAFRESTLLRVLNQGFYDQVPAQMRRWQYDNGLVVLGLKNRREQEVALWESA